MKFLIFIVFIIAFDGIFLAIRERMLRLDNENAKVEAQMLKNTYKIYKITNDGQFDALKSQIESLNSLNRELIFKNSMLKQQNQQLKEAVYQYQIAQRLVYRMPPETVEAVKYAMKKAHPDNGGKVEDFEKFRKCYEELTRI